MLVKSGRGRGKVEVERRREGQMKGLRDEQRAR